MAAKGKYFKELSRRDYINKASEIVKKEGSGALSIRRIAREMNCTSACLYHYFENVDELLYYVNIAYLNYYLEQLKENAPKWRDVWDMHIGIWECYARAAFTYPEAFNMIFFSDMSKKLGVALQEYYEIYPEYISLVTNYLQDMLRMPDFFERDFQMCQKCAEAGVISFANAKRMNRITCMLYKGYLKGIIDEGGLRPEEIEGTVESFIRDFKLVIASLAADFLGHKDLMTINLHN